MGKRFRVYRNAVNKIPQLSLFNSKHERGTKAKQKQPPAYDGIQVKLAILNSNFHPVPFAPTVPDLRRHERLFRTLGLWDFLHLNLPTDPLRPDLLAQLIAHYNPTDRGSNAAGVPISVCTRELARALSLPILKISHSNDDLTLFSREETAHVLVDFILDWLVLLDDGCVPPREVVAALKLVKEGQPHEVDWAKLVWAVVRKDLPITPRTGQTYYYASHLQRLIKHQHPELFHTVDNSAAAPEIPNDVATSMSEEVVEAGRRARERKGINELAAESSADNVTNKRCIDDIDGTDNVDNVPLTTRGNLLKKICSDGKWGMEHVQYRMEETPKAEEGNVEKEQECKSVRSELQHNAWKQKDHTIRSLKKAEKAKAALAKKERKIGKAQMKLRYMNNKLQEEGHTIWSLEQAIANGQTELQYMNDLLHHKDRTICSLEQAITNGQTELQYMNDMLRTKTHTIWSLEQVIANGPTELRYTNDMLQQKDQAIRSLEQAIANAQMEMQSMNNTVQEKDHNIISLEKEKMEAEQKVKVVLVEKELAIVNAQTEIQFMKKNLQQKDEMIQSLEKGRIEETQKVKEVLVEKELAIVNAQAEIQFMNKKLQQKDEMIQSLKKGRIEETQKVKEVLVEKELAIVNAQTEIQFVNKKLQQKDETIQSLEKGRIEEIQKAKVALVEKELAIVNSQTEVQSLYNMLQQNDRLIRTLEKEKLEEEQKVKVVLMEKDQAIANAKAELQYRNNMLQQKDHTIKCLEKEKLEVAQKVKVALMEKEQACQATSNSQMKLHHMNNMLLLKDQNIRSLEKAKMEEARKRELEASQFADELSVMTRTIDGYKKDLKEKEEEMRHTAAGVINCFERDWSVKFTECADLIPQLAVKFMELNENFELLKETYAKPKVSETE